MRSRCQQGSVSGEDPFLARRWLLCPHIIFPLSLCVCVCVYVFERERESVLSGVFSYKDSDPIRSGPHSYDLI